jgi:hypothetical protein
VRLRLPLDLIEGILDITIAVCHASSDWKPCLPRAGLGRGGYSDPGQKPGKNGAGQPTPAAIFV